MKKLPQLFANNQQWAQRMVALDPQYFTRLRNQQSPKYLWIGCADSRVPANEITGLEPGEIFVHRNVANLVIHSDFNSLAVIQYAVEHLRVEHIIICGHENCGGVKASMEDRPHGLVDNWIRPIRELYLKNLQELKPLDEDARLHRLCELNVRKQVENLCSSTIVQDAWKRNHTLTIHGWFYSLTDGLLHDTGLCIQSLAEADHLLQSSH